MLASFVSWYLSVLTKSHLCPSCITLQYFDQESLMPFLHYIYPSILTKIPFYIPFLHCAFKSLTKSYSCPSYTVPFNILTKFHSCSSCTIIMPHIRITVLVWESYLSVSSSAWSSLLWVCSASWTVCSTFWLRSLLSALESACVPTKMTGEPGAWKHRNVIKLH